MLSSDTLLADRYLIGEPLGQGGMGRVFQAVDQQTAQPVAVKELLLEASPDRREGLLEQVRQEARMLMRLEHPGLPRLIEFLEEAGRPILVMELIAGKNLSAVLSQEGPQDEARVLEWLEQLAVVLDYLHKHQVVFRDLKPSNLMLTGSGTLKLVDFGIAKTLAGEADRTRTVARGLVSAGFSAPEQYTGGTDPQSDLYSLGATCYALLTGRVPPESVELAAGSQILEPLATLRPDLLPSTVELVDWMMQLKKAQRPLSARQLLTRLRHAGWDEPPTGRVLSRSLVRARRFWPRRVWLGLGVLALLSLLWLGWHRPAEVRVVTTPQGARVLVNDVPRGLSPLTLTVPRGTRLRVELDGYQPVSDVLDFQAPGGEIHLQLLPGPLPVSHADSVWAPAPGAMTEPSFYPALWGPPPTLRPRLDHQVEGFAFGVPAGWSVVEEGPQQVVLAGGDGRSSPRRSATLTVEPDQGADLQEVLGGLEQREQARGWLSVRRYLKSDLILVRLERKAGPLEGRALLALGRRSLAGRPALVIVRMECAPSGDVYDFTRQVDVLRAYLPVF
ncbi:PEGA domain-containing protein [bacterium CPR1]|nr:PEGA domain-containing protein [bacterium CPR1]